MTSHTELIEELQVAIDDLRALHVAKKNDMESITGFSADAIATLYEASRDRISTLTAALERAESFLRRMADGDSVIMAETVEAEVDAIVATLTKGEGDKPSNTQEIEP
jgi:hypothetical protein